MSTGRSQFIGTAGQFHVAYDLAVREINAAITLGNAPSVDIMASSHDGKRSLALQVKTARHAYRKNRYGHEGFEWDVNKSVIGKHHESFWYAFVDLNCGASIGELAPQVFLVPSRWVAEFVKDDWSRFMYFLPSTVKDMTLERWDMASGYLSGTKEAVDWANSWPEDQLVK